MTDADARRVLSHELYRRLRPVCSQWPEDQFTQMIERLAEITIKYDRGFGVTYDRRATDRLVADLKGVLERSEATRDDESKAGATEGLTEPGGGS
jgi:hypothetical protein